MDSEVTDFFWSKEKCKCAWQGSGHLVSRNSELLKLYVELWVALRRGGTLGLSSRLPDVKKTQT